MCALLRNDARRGFCRRSPIRLIALVFFCAVGVSAQEVWFVSGFLSGLHPQEDALGILQKVFPDATVSLWNWESTGHLYHECQDIADKEGAVIAQAIEKMSTAERENLVLVGHSLGGRIVVRTMALLAKNGLKIERAVILGAAIPYDDDDIPVALHASKMPNIIVYNHNDDILRQFYPLGEDQGDGERNFYRIALGLRGFTGNYSPQELIQWRSNDVFEDFSSSATCESHNPISYLSCFARNFQKNAPDMPPSVMVKSASHADKITVLPIFHTCLASCCGWRLLRVKVTGRYIIVDPFDHLFLSVTKKERNTAEGVFRQIQMECNLQKAE